MNEWRAIVSEACAHQLRGELDLAIAGYERALALGVDVADVWFNLAAAYRHRGHVAESLRAYARVIALEPDRAEAWNNLGLALDSDGSPEAAGEAFERALALDDGCVAAWINLGNARRSSGARRAAVEAYRGAIAREAESAAAWYNLHAALYDDADPSAAEGALERALSIDPDHAMARFHLGALRWLHQSDPRLLEALPPEQAFLVDSARFVAAARDDATRLTADTFTTLRLALAAAPRAGVAVELGVRRGTSLRFLAAGCGGRAVHGFDAFEGLPERWGDEPEGLYTTGGALPELPASVTLHPGWFRDTLPAFADSLSEPLALVHVDCDLHSSTREAFEHLGPSVAEKTVIAFDDYLANPGWRDEEHRAFCEAARRHGWRYRYLAFGLFTRQAVVRIERIDGGTRERGPV